MTGAHDPGARVAPQNLTCSFSRRFMDPLGRQGDSDRALIEHRCIGLSGARRAISIAAGFLGAGSGADLRNMRCRLLCELARPVRAPPGTFEQRSGRSNGQMRGRDLQFQPEPSRYVQLARRCRDVALMRSGGLALFGALMLVSCDPGDINQNAHAPKAADGDRAPMSVRSTERLTRAFRISPNGLVPADELGAAVRDAGYPCDAVTGMGQLEQGGKALDIYRIDCGSQSYDVMITAPPPANVEGLKKALV